MMSSPESAAAPRQAPRRGAILLAGGRASRMGGVDKTRLIVGGRTLLDAAIAAVAGIGCSPIVVAGPSPTGAGGIPVPTDESVRWHREDPPFGGPAAAVVSVLDAGFVAGPEWVYLLACDLPRVEAAVHRLDAELPLHGDGVCLMDADARAQWLTGVYRTAALLAAAGRMPARGRDGSMRVLLAGLDIAFVADDDEITGDIDTWDDYHRLTKGTP